MNIKRTLPFFLVAGLLSLSILSTVVTPVRAFTNAFVDLGHSQCNAGCTNPLTLAITIATANDILVIETSCETNNQINTITDTKLNAFGVANRQQVPFTVPSGDFFGVTGADPVSGTGSLEMCIFGQSTSWVDTVTITFAATNQYCDLEIVEGNTPSIAVNTGTVATFAFQGTGMVGTVTTTLTNSYAASSIPANSIILSFGSMFGIRSQSAVAHQVTTNAPQTDAGSFFIDFPVTIGISGGYFVTTSQAVVIQDSYAHSAGTGTNHDEEILMSIVLAQQGILPTITPPPYTWGCGHAAASTTSYTFTGNSTLYYPLWPTGSGTVTSVQVDVKAVALTNGQTNAIMLVQFYTSLQNPMTTGQLPSTSDRWFPAGSDSVILTNNASPKNYTFFPSSGSFAVGGRAVALGVSITHNGVTLRQANAVSNAMYYDNASLKSTNQALTQSNAASKNACFGTTVVPLSITQTATFSNVVSTTQTITQNTITVITGTVTQTVVSAPIVESDKALFSFLVGLGLIAGIGIVFAMLAAKHSQSGSGALVGMIFGAMLGTILYVLFVDPSKAWVLAIVVVGMILTIVLGSKSGVT